jgi:hypothetical protein
MVFHFDSSPDSLDHELGFAVNLLDALRFQTAHNYSKRKARFGRVLYIHVPLPSWSGTVFSDVANFRA